MNNVRFDDRIKRKRIDIGKVFPTVVSGGMTVNGAVTCIRCPLPPAWMARYGIQMLLLSTLCQRCLSEPTRSRRHNNCNQAEMCQRSRKRFLRYSRIGKSRLVAVRWRRI